MTLTQVRTFQPGQVRTASVTVLNTGNVPTVYALEITAGETGIFGFAAQRSPVLVLTPPVSPGSQRQIDLPVQLPDAPGPKAFRIRIGQAGPTGQIIQEFDEELFTGLAEVAQLPAEIPLPTEVPAPPALPTAQELALQFRDALGRPSITVSPTQAEQGETVSGNLSIPSAAAIPFTPRLTVTLIQFTSAGAFEVRTIVQPRSISLGPGDDITQGLSIDTAALAESVYGLRVLLIDPTTGIVLVDETFNNLFTVTLPAIPTLPVPPVPTAKLQPGDFSGVGPFVTIAGSLTATTAAPGDEVVVRVGLINSTQITQLVVLDVRLAPPAGEPIDLSMQVTVVPGTNTFTAPSWIVPTTAPSGGYGIRIIVIDPTTLTVLVDRNFGTMFSVGAAPAPTGALALDLVSVVVRPSTVRPRSTIAIDVTVRNTSSASGQLEFRAQVINDIGALPDLSGRLATRNNVPIGPNATITQSWTWTVPDDPADYPTGRQYGVFVAVLDESTQAELIVRSVRPLFTIEAAPPAPAPVDEFLEEELAPPAPAPIPRPSDLAIAISYGPSITRFGQQTTLTVQVTNIGDFNFGVEVDAKLMLPDTNFGQEIIPRTFGLLVVDQRRLFTGVLSTANLPGGSYGARVTVRSFASGRIITVVNQPAILVVIQ